MVKIGDRVKRYNMYSKRYRSYYIVGRTKDGRLQLSRIKNGGVSAYADTSEVELRRGERR